MIQDYKDEYIKSNSRIMGGCGLHHYSNIDDWFNEIDKIVVGKSDRRIQSYTYLCVVDEKVVLNNGGIFVEEIIEEGEENLAFKFI